MGVLLIILQYCGWAALAVSAAYWLFSFVFALRIYARVPVVTRLPLRELAAYPKISVIIPACNEETAIEEAVTSKLADGYPHLEVVIVNDRSTDRTGEIAQRLAAADPRVRVIHVTDLPAGWLGKVHAMQRAVELTDGEWILLSDADVHLAPGTLQRVIGHAQERGLEHLACLPDLWPTKFWVDVALCTFVRFFSIAARLWAVENPNSTASCGIGAFNLVRRAALAKTEGLEHLRLTVVDDVGLGQMMKQSGAKCAVLNGRGCVGLTFYRSMAEMARGTEKNVPALGNFSFWRLMLRTAGFLLLETTAFAALFISAGAVWYGVWGVVGLGLLTQVLFCRWMNRPLLPALFSPLGAVIFAVLMIRSGALEVWRGGIMWRGTLYPTKLLRSEQRFEFL